MAGKNTAVFGIYKSSAQAERAVDRIAAAGFSHNNISVLLQRSIRADRFSPPAAQSYACGIHLRLVA